MTNPLLQDVNARREAAGRKPMALAHDDEQQVGLLSDPDMMAGRLESDSAGDDKAAEAHEQSTQAWDKSGSAKTVQEHADAGDAHVKAGEAHEASEAGDGASFKEVHDAKAAEHYNSAANLLTRTKQSDEVIDDVGEASTD